MDISQPMTNGFKALQHGKIDATPLSLCPLPQMCRLLPSAGDLGAARSPGARLPTLKVT